MDLGNKPAGTTVRFFFNTYDSAGALVTASSLAASDVEIYKAGSTTQRASDNGITVSVDFDGVTGLHMVAIDLTDDSDSGFYAVGSDYAVSLGPFTVATQTVGIVRSFRIVAAESVAGTPKVDVSHNAGTAITASGGRQEVNVSHLGGSTAPVSNLVLVYDTDFATNYDTTEDRWAVLTRKIFDINSGDYNILNIDTDGNVSVGNIGSANARTGIAESVWDAVRTSHSTATTFGESLQDTVASRATASELAKVPKSDSNVTWNATALASINSQCDTALSDVGLTSTVTGRIDAAISSRSSHTAANVRTEMDSNSTQLAAIVADTNELQTDWVNGGRLDLIVDAINAKTTNLPASPAATGDIPSAAAIRTEIDSNSTKLAQIVADLPARITKNTALANFPFKMVNTAGTALTGLTITATRSLDGAAFAACANSASEISDGWYKIDLAAGDLNGNNIVLRFTGTGAKATEIQIVTQNT